MANGGPCHVAERPTLPMRWHGRQRKHREAQRKHAWQGCHGVIFLPHGQVRLFSQDRGAFRLVRRLLGAPQSRCRRSDQAGLLPERSAWQRVGLGLFSPPFGLGLYAACAITGTHMPDVVGPMLKYLAVLFLALMLLVVVPQFSLWLPTYFGFG